MAYCSLGRLAWAACVALLAVSLVACGGAENRKARHLENGREYLEAENFEKARVEFRNALQIDPNDAESRYLLGRSLEKLGNVREAAGMYQAAIDSNADHLGARASVGRIFVFGGAPDRALEYIAPGLLKAPDDPDLLTVRAAAKSQKGGARQRSGQRKRDRARGGDLSAARGFAKGGRATDSRYRETA
jgi:Tfp pilus assembly protein PilF